MSFIPLHSSAMQKALIVNSDRCIACLDGPAPGRNAILSLRIGYGQKKQLFVDAPKDRIQQTLSISKPGRGGYVILLDPFGGPPLEIGTKDISMIRGAHGDVAVLTFQDTESGAPVTLTTGSAFEDLARMVQTADIKGSVIKEKAPSRKGAAPGFFSRFFQAALPNR